MVSSQVYFVSL